MSMASCVIRMAAGMYLNKISFKTTVSQRSSDSIGFVALIGGFYSTPRAITANGWSISIEISSFQPNKIHSCYC